VAKLDLVSLLQRATPASPGLGAATWLPVNCQPPVSQTQAVSPAPLAVAAAFAPPPPPAPAPYRVVADEELGPVLVKNVIGIVKL
jgi:hypothetical protein